jgi:deazaflavin-dependent oxidoreductase (nitroreductase family)
MRRRVMAEVNDQNAPIIAEFRANEGRVGGRFEGAPLLILHSVGAKSGEARVHPMMYQAVADTFAVFASYAGGPKHPAWFHNLVANPDVSVEVGTGVVDVTARVVEGEEREAIWTVQKERYPQFAGYEEKAPREIPVVVLKRRG